MTLAILTDSSAVAAHPAEASLCSCVIQDPERIPDVIDVVRPGEFRDAGLGQLYALACRMFREGVPIDAVTIAMEARRVGVPVSGSALVEVVSFAPSSTAALYWARRVRESAAHTELRRAMSALDDAIGAGSGVDEAMQAVDAALVSARVGDAYKPRMLTEIAREELDVMDEETRSDARGYRWSTGILALDAPLLGGPKPTDLVVIGGRPAMGKTALGVQIADACADAGGIVHVYSGEMSGGQLCRRLLAQWSNVPGSRLQRPRNLGQGDWQAIVDGLSNAEEAAHEVWVDDRGGLSWDEVEAGARRTAARRGRVDMVLVDYLQLLRVPQKSNEYVAYTEASKAAKALAKNLQCVVVLLCQLNRGNQQRQDKRPVMSDLRATGQIEQDADVILFPYRFHEDDESALETDAEVNIAKHRGGRCARVPVVWRGELTRFEEGGVL